MAINNYGQIVTTGRQGGPSRVFFLQPLPYVTSVAVSNGAVVLYAALQTLARRS